MSWYRHGWVHARGAIVLGMLAIGSAQAGSNWFALDPDKTLCDVHSSTCTIELAWSVGNAGQVRRVEDLLDAQSVTHLAQR